jgi:hypothetical protein
MMREIRTFDDAVRSIMDKYRPFYNNNMLAIVLEIDRAVSKFAKVLTQTNRLVVEGDTLPSAVLALSTDYKELFWKYVLDHGWNGLMVAVARGIHGSPDEVIAEMVISKQHDYGSGNICRFGDFGIAVRLTDKIERLKNLLGKNLSPNNESIVDTWKDICGYAIVGLLLNRQQFLLPLAESIEHQSEENYIEPETMPVSFDNRQKDVKTDAKCCGANEESECRCRSNHRG